MTTLLPLVMIAFLINQQWNAGQEHPVIQNLRNNPEIGNFSLLAVTTVIVAPLFEELIFRGLLQGGLQKLVGFVPALCLQGALFASLHMANTWLPLFLLATALTLVTAWSGSLLPAVVMHALFNGANMLQLSLEIHKSWWQNL